MVCFFEFEAVSCDYAATPLEECYNFKLASATGDRCLSQGHAPLYDLENLCLRCTESVEADAMRDEERMKALLHKEVVAEAERREYEMLERVECEARWILEEAHL